MNLTSLFDTSGGILFAVLLCVFAAFSATLIVSYFISLRPRRGTTEWMKRLDRPKFAPLRKNSLRWSDLAWALLSAFCAAVLRLVALAVTYLQIGRIDLIMKHIHSLLTYSFAPIFLMAACLYLLLRSLFGQSFPAVCAAVLTGLVQLGGVWCAAVLTASLLLLWLWTASDADAPLFPKMLLFFFSVGGFLLAAVRYPAVAWLSPLYLIAYIYVQLFRWRNGKKHPRGVSLAVSLLLVFFLMLGAVALLWVLYCYLHGQLHSVLDLRLMLEVLPQKFAVRLRALFLLPRPLAALYRADAFALLLGMAAAVPMLHGIFKRRDSRCLALLVSLVCFAAMWIFGGTYSAVPMLLPLIGLSWSTLTERKYSGLMVCYAVGTAVVYFAVRFLH